MASRRTPLNRRGFAARTPTRRKPETPAEGRANLRQTMKRYNKRKAQRGSRTTARSSGSGG